MGIKSVLAFLALGLAAMASAQTANYPNRPVTLIVPAGAGGGTDVVARVLADELGKRLGQAVVVDNKTGASGMLGTQAVARAAPDGHTLLVAYSTPIFYAHHIFAKVPYDIRKDFEFISQLAATSLVMMVNADVPAKNMKEFMAWAQQNKGKVNYGSYGQGSPGHLMSAYLSDSRKLDMTHVAYKSEAPHIQDLAGGVVSWGLGTIAAAQGALKDKRIRPIAIYGPKRLAELPDVATMAEQGFADPEFNTVAWFTLLAPAGTPKPILQRLEKETVEIIHSTAMKARFQVFGLESVPGGAARFHKDFDAVDPVIQKLVRISGVKAN
ncbi:MAG TPA: tripartite tricarboxylate transporter substrate binding protein [Ottowia sp.]|uniref:Bug family tripartite tricarboxylate transporter substrate binding protein n=1 Tax=Ottowia sp. TaxID=1898956 RepID=UPI002CEEA4CE|nr:tripartite tricarboxylate transporter substrate binding protein [Ottowia sp.]HNE60510.1 tripartite tricarboxylate transporter substrate binding protein [Ottowia sp.]HNI85555.1 tripartite tricarboxylate transporter substrate binding protein [Ottowia sp.]HNK53380.1 tripartite tricarboxylate transporter substrate binding protein [Ottowia sp.]HNL42299.1 tripartite tricarboxylate transporter substrate binding protein [Ottowia sp.]HNN33756.1 tripartite tricarboxylate transporter substrate binding